MVLRRVLLLLSLVAALAGCEQAPDTMQQSCSVERAAEMPIYYAGGFLLVRGALDGKPVVLLLDTGSQGSSVTPAAVERLQLDRSTHRTLVHGVGGDVETADVELDSFAVGPLRMVERTLAVSPVEQIPGIPPISGIIGADFLADYDLDLDPRHHLLTLFRTRHCGIAFAPWPNAGAPLTLNAPDRNLIAVDVQVDAQTVGALVDTGARNTVIDLAAAQRLGVAADSMQGDPAFSGHGVDPQSVTGHVHRFPNVRIGHEVFRNVALEVAGVKIISGTDMLLGADFLHTRHVWLSYATHQMFLAPPGL